MSASLTTTPEILKTKSYRKSVNSSNYYKYLKKEWNYLKQKPYGKLDDTWNNLFSECDYKPTECPHSLSSPSPSHSHHTTNNNTLSTINCCTDADRKRLYYFRNNLYSYISNYICTSSKFQTKCERIGSNNFSSDIDVSIMTFLNDEEFKLVSLNAIKVFLADFFETSPNRVFQFFDMNFYLTEYAIKNDGSSIVFNNINANPNITPILYLDEFCISKSIKQYDYAFYEYMYMINPKNRPVHDSEEYNMLIERISQDKIQLHSMVNSSESSKGIFDGVVEEMINSVSEISTAEDETYHTQGSFFHVVLKMQKKLQINCDNRKHSWVFLLCTSFIENLCFAYTHFHKNKQVKYLTRCNDAINELEKINVKSSLIQPIIIKIHIQPTIKQDAIKTIIESLYSIVQTVQYGGSGHLLNLCKLVNKSNNPVKKNFMHKPRTIYVDQLRNQYVKWQGIYTRITTLRALEKKTATLQQKNT